MNIFKQIFCLVFTILLGLGCLTSYANPKLKVIAIGQLVAHESLDKVHDGIIDELRAEGYENNKTARILYENAQNNLSTSVQIAKQFVTINPNVIVAIATPQAQAVASASKNTSIPVVFASITDPVQAGLVADLHHPEKNITGTRNASPFKQQMALIKKILPAATTIGIVLNEGEANSVDALQAATAAAKYNNLEVKSATVTDSSQVGAATASLVKRVNAIFLLQDNTVASALPSLLKISNTAQIPVFSSYISAVQEGALAGLAVDEYDMGRQTGKIVAKILSGQFPGNIPVVDPNKITLAINLTCAKELKISIGKDLINNAQVVYPQIRKN